MKRLSLDRKISPLSLKPPIVDLDDFPPDHDEITGTRGEETPRPSRDKIPFFRVYPESKEIGSELESIQSGGGYLYLPRGMLVFWVPNLFFFILCQKLIIVGSSIQRELEIQFKERGKRRKTTRVPNRDELFTLPIGFNGPSRQVSKLF